LINKNEKNDEKSSLGGGVAITRYQTTAHFGVFDFHSLYYLNE
jgi:hypothetical protein